MHSRAQAFYLPYEVEKIDLPKVIDEYQKRLAYYAFIVSVVSIVFLILGLRAGKSAPLSYAFIIFNSVGFAILAVHIFSSIKNFIKNIMDKIDTQKSTSLVQMKGLINTNLTILLQLYFFLYVLISLLGIANSI